MKRDKIKSTRFLDQDICRNSKFYLSIITTLPVTGINENQYLELQIEVILNYNSFSRKKSVTLEVI